MKHVTFKWLKRLWVLIAAKLIIIAVLLTIARFAITGVDDYKEQLVEWVAAEHNINVDAQKVSAGIDFSGLVLTLNNVTLIDTQVLPFELKIDYLFLHFDFLDSLTKQKLIFNDISLKGANLLLKPSPKTNSQIKAQLNEEESNQQPKQQSELTLDALKNIFLLHLSSFSITDSRINFTDHLYNKKTILIQDLSWINDGNRHQGVGKASLPYSLGENTLEFLIDIKGDAEASNDKLIGSFYAEAANLNATEYLKPQINPLAELKKAIVSFKLWSDFDFNGPKNIQLEWGNSEIAWSILNESHEWQINDGLLQFSDQDKHWLFDSYDLNITHNYIPFSDIKLSGSGIDGEFGEFDLNGVNVNSIVPFTLLFSSLSEVDLKQVLDLELGGAVEKVGLIFDKPGEFSVSANIDAFNNKASGAIPGISDANISIVSNTNAGRASIKLGPQNVYFDGQFSRAMPVKNAQFELRWTNDKNGFELISDKSVLVTDDLNSTTQFSLLFANKDAADTSPFLSLYTYASLNDATKAQHYLPVLALGDDLFNYLQPTLKKGSVEGAKILWFGRLSDYPYQQNDGVFQAWVPVIDGQYDFYKEWAGLTDLDLDLLFENDTLQMTSEKAQLGDMRVDSLSATIDHLSPDGILTINAKVEETAQSIAKYLLNSPLKDSVGKAVKMIHIDDKLKGNLTLKIPFNSGTTLAKGKLNLNSNDIDIKLTDDLTLPLKKVQGAFSFVNGDLTANNLSATLFDQPVNFSFASKDLKDKYQLKANLSGQWDVAKLSRYQKQLLPLQLSGNLDWQGQIDFTQSLNQDYKFAVNLSSQLQGVKVNLPSPYNKNPLQAWPTTININGDQRRTQWNVLINNKLTSVGELDLQSKNKQQPLNIKYLYLGLGQDQGLVIDKTKQVIRISEDKVNLTAWTEIINDWFADQESLTSAASNPGATTVAKNKTALINIEDFYVDIKHAELFEQPLVNLNAHAMYINNHWGLKLKADNLFANIEYRQGIPDRYDINIQDMNFQLFDIDAAQALFAKPQLTSLPEVSDNLREDYPEVFLECLQCRYKKMQLSPLKAHVFPSKERYSIDYLSLGEAGQATTISGIWDQRRTNIIVDSATSSNNNIVHRLGYTNPMVYEKAELSGALNWVGAPWLFNFESLNGTLSMQAENGQITEVDDKGARLLSFLSLDGIRRSLNLEFGNVFSKGLGFDKMSLSANITNGVFKNDDYYLDGSAGKISGAGLIDLPNLNVNYRFSYSPAVTSSLPVLAAFAINPLTGAAVLMLTKIFEPVVDSIIRVDFSVKGALTAPEVKIEDRQRGVVKLQNSEVLEKIEERTLDSKSLEKQVIIK